MSDTISDVPTIGELSPEDFREKLAGISREKSDPAENDIMHDYAVRLLLVACRVYGAELDKIKIWEKLFSAIEVAYSASQGIDIDLFTDALFAEVQADVNRLVGDPDFNLIREFFDVSPDEKRQVLSKQFIDHVYRRKYVLIMEARFRRKSEQESKQ